jgi:exodeoxyribonuclease VIII
MIKTENFASYAVDPAINASFLKQLKKCSVENNDTVAMNFGTAFHTYILEPELFAKQYYVFDDTEQIQKGIDEGLKNVRGSKMYKEWHAAETIKAGSRLMFGIDNYRTLQAMAERLKLNNPNAATLIQNSVHEKSIYQTIEIDGREYAVKCRIDGLISELNVGVIWDLKKTVNAHPDGFGRECGKYGYHISAAFYKRLAELEFNKPFEVFIIAQEETAPYNSGLYRVSPAMISKGNVEVDKLLKLAAHVKRTGELSSYEIFSSDPYGILDLDIPNYYATDYELNI